MLLFGGLTLSKAFISAEETLQQAWADMDARASAVAHTAINPVDMRILNGGGLIELTLQNSGSLKLADFDRWDVFVEYYDTATMSAYHVEQFPYSRTEASQNQWSVEKIYQDKQNRIAESYDPGIFDPGEAVVLHLNVSPAIGVGQSAQVSVVTDKGIRASMIDVRNAPPTLVLNAGLKVANTGSGLITADSLLAQDADHQPDELTYTITTPPTQGTLTPATRFTQAQIDSGEVFYTHTGTDSDSFSFTLADGINVIGPFTYSITINQPPSLQVNAGLTLASGTTATITNALLKVSDADDPPEKLIYTVTQFPANGMLSLGSTFSQADIDANRLTYTHVNTGATADQFKFMVADGCDVIGSYTFIITAVAQDQAAPPA